MGWLKFGLLGHSMGAGMCSLYAATYPEHVEVRMPAVEDLCLKTDHFTGIDHVRPGEALQQKG